MNFTSIVDEVGQHFVNSLGHRFVYVGEGVIRLVPEESTLTKEWDFLGLHDWYFSIIHGDFTLGPLIAAPYVIHEEPW